MWLEEFTLDSLAESLAKAAALGLSSVDVLLVSLALNKMRLKCSCAFSVDRVEVKKETGRRDGADAPSSQLPIFAILEANTVQSARGRGVPDAIGPEDALLSEVSEVRLALTRS